MGPVRRRRPAVLPRRLARRAVGAVGGVELMDKNKCEMCDKPVPKPNARFCSIRCRNIHNARKQKSTKQHRICPICGKEFFVHLSSLKRGQGKYCSYKCAGMARKGKNNHNYKGKISRICQNCGKEFEAYPVRIRQGRASYCSSECASEAHRSPRAIVQCAHCGEVLEITYARLNMSENHYCSPRCFHENMKKAEEDKKSTTLQICSNCGKEFWANTYDVRKGMGRFCSQSCYGNYLSHTASASYSRGHGGKREDLEGLYVRSSWEANWARYLNWLTKQGMVESWEYEPETFEFPIKRGSKFYTPDFKVKFASGKLEYHEVKGYMDQKSRTKLKRMTKYYPQINIIIIDRELYKSVEQDVSLFIPTWERN